MLSACIWGRNANNRLSRAHYQLACFSPGRRRLRYHWSAICPWLRAVALISWGVRRSSTVRVNHRFRHGATKALVGGRVVSIDRRGRANMPWNECISSIARLHRAWALALPCPPRGLAFPRWLVMHMFFGTVGNQNWSSRLSRGTSIFVRKISVVSPGRKRAWWVSRSSCRYSGGRVFGAFSSKWIQRCVGRAPAPASQYNTQCSEHNAKHSCNYPADNRSRHHGLLLGQVVRSGSLFW